MDRMSLRDQPILDKYQGDVFRMPLVRQLVLLGPPGTGIFTTLIRRLAQKRHRKRFKRKRSKHFELRTGGRRRALGRCSRPPILGTCNLRDAFNQEGVLRPHLKNLRTWERQRLDLARNTLEFCGSRNLGGFSLTTLLRCLPNYLRRGGLGFSRRFHRTSKQSVYDRFADAVEQLSRLDDSSLRQRVNSIVGRFERSEDRLSSPTGQSSRLLI